MNEYIFACFKFIYVNFKAGWQTFSIRAYKISVAYFFLSCFYIFLQTFKNVTNILTLQAVQKQAVISLLTPGLSYFPNFIKSDKLINY